MHFVTGNQLGDLFLSLSFYFFLYVFPKWLLTSSSERVNINKHAFFLLRFRPVYCGATHTNTHENGQVAPNAIIKIDTRNIGNKKASSERRMKWSSAMALCFAHTQITHTYGTQRIMRERPLCLQIHITCELLVHRRSQTARRVLVCMHVQTSALLSHSRARCGWSQAGQWRATHFDTVGLCAREGSSFVATTTTTATVQLRSELNQNAIRLKSYWMTMNHHRRIVTTNE